jgi:hypothetical protein
MAAIYPALDGAIVIDFDPDGPFGALTADISFSSADQTLTFSVTKGSLAGKVETLPFQAHEVTDGIWMVTWQETDLLTVVHVQDFNTGKLLSAVTTSDQHFVFMSGTVSLAS